RKLISKKFTYFLQLKFSLPPQFHSVIFKCSSVSILKLLDYITVIAQKKNNKMNNSEPKTYNLTIYLIKEALEKNENPINSKTVAKRINFILGNNLEAMLPTE